MEKPRASVIKILKFEGYCNYNAHYLPGRKSSDTFRKSQYWGDLKLSTDLEYLGGNRIEYLGGNSYHFHSPSNWVESS